MINCFGETDIEKCELIKSIVIKKMSNFLNLILSKKKNNLNFKVIHFSTDQVYNNKKF